MYSLISGYAFDCNQPGHLSNNCPNRQAVNLDEGGATEEQTYKEDIYEGAEIEDGDVKEEVANIVQRILLA